MKAVLMEMKEAFKLLLEHGANPLWRNEPR